MSTGAWYRNPAWSGSRRKRDASPDQMVPLATARNVYRQPSPPIPDRLSVARDVLLQFVENRRNDQIGLVVFSNFALTRVPLTFAHSVVREELAAISHTTTQEMVTPTATRSMGSQGSTAIGEGLALGTSMLRFSEAE